MKSGTHHRWDRMPKERITAQIERRFVHGERAMVAQVFLKKGAVVQTHTHESEQITYILEGALRLWLGAWGGGPRRPARCRRLQPAEAGLDRQDRRLPAAIASALTRCAEPPARRPRG